MIYNSFRYVLKTSLSLIKVQSHLFGKPVLVYQTLEKASTLVQLYIRFKARNEATHLETGFLKMLTKNMFSFVKLLLLS